LGLPMLDVNGLAAPLSEWEIRASTVSGNTGTATLVHGDRAIRFPMTYNKGRWYFAIGPIEQFRWVR